MNGIYDRCSGIHSAFEMDQKSVSLCIPIGLTLSIEYIEGHTSCSHGGRHVFLQDRVRVTGHIYHLHGPVRTITASIVPQLDFYQTRDPKKKTKKKKTGVLLQVLF